MYVKFWYRNVVELLVQTLFPKLFYVHATNK